MGTLRKIFTTSVGAALMTEEGLRNAFADIKLTSQARDYIARQALKGKEEVTKVVAGEIKRFLDHVDLHKVLTGLTLNVEATITLGPRTGRRDHSKVTIRSLRIRKKR